MFIMVAHALTNSTCFKKVLTNKILENNGKRKN